MQAIKEEWVSLSFWIEIVKEEEVLISLQRGLNQIEESPQKVEGYHYAARGYFLLGDLNEAYRIYDIALKIFPLEIKFSFVFLHGYLQIIKKPRNLAMIQTLYL